MTNDKKIKFNGKNWERQDLLNLYEQAKKFKNKRVYACVMSRSSNGMSRNIRMFTLRGEYPSYNIALVLEQLGYKMHKNTYDIKVNGCGMDMIFHLLSNLNYAMHDLDLALGFRKRKSRTRIYDKY